ncbi:MAG: hypothetical protein PHY32_03085 [Candidatus Pacebacteria bacterium]|nr:hypothetical protein [Candidatus Paceibacterota bacterium]
MYFYSNTVTISVKNNSEEEQKDNGSKSGENIPDGYGRVTFKCENCKIGEIGNCSHITVKRPGTGITG